MAPIIRRTCDTSQTSPKIKPMMMMVVTFICAKVSVLSRMLILFGPTYMPRMAVRQTDVEWVGAECSGHVCTGCHDEDEIVDDARDGDDHVPGAQLAAAAPIMQAAAHLQSCYMLLHIISEE